MNNIQTLMKQIDQFRQMYNGNPKQQVQQMLNSGKITQSQYDAAVQQANQIAKMIGINIP